MISFLTFDLAFNPMTALAGQALPYHGALPVSWLSSRETVFPITEAPETIQWQTWVMIRSISHNAVSEPVWIDVPKGHVMLGERIVNYLIERHGFPQDRFLIRTVEKEGWSDWIAIYPQGYEPEGAPPSWQYDSSMIIEDEIHVSLASPKKTESFPVTQSAYDSEEQVEAKTIGLRPSIGIEWFNARARISEGHDIRATWIGLSGRGETTLIGSKWMDFDVGGHYFGSISSVTPDALGTNVSEGSLYLQALLKLAPTIFGRPEIAGMSGFYANFRISTGANPGFLPAMRGPFSGFWATTTFDEVMAIGFGMAYVFTYQGVILGEGFMRHRLFGTETLPWDIRLGLSLATARMRMPDVYRKEYWSSIQFGLAGSL